MRFAFGIVNLFAGGGLQRDCVGIAQLLRDRGHANRIGFFLQQIDTHQTRR